MRTPLVVVTGVDPVSMDTTLLSLAWDLPRAASVRHRIDPHSQVLTRTVSDVTGIVEQEETQLEHACVSCALREDILPTLERLARDDRWSSIVAGLPTATEAGQLAHVLATDSRLARHLKLSNVIATVGAADVVRDLLSDDLLRERGVHSNPHDDRGVGEVACAQVEFADVVVLDADPGAEATDLLHALARPGAPVVIGADRLDGAQLTADRHHNSLATAWCSPELDVELPPLGASHAWRLDLRSPRPFHPDRLLDQIERLGRASRARPLLGADASRRHAGVVGRRGPAQHRGLQPVGTSHAGDPTRRHRPRHAPGRREGRVRGDPPHPPGGSTPAAVGRPRGRTRALARRHPRRGLTAPAARTHAPSLPPKEQPWPSPSAAPHAATPVIAGPSGRRHRSTWSLSPSTAGPIAFHDRSCAASNVGTSTLLPGALDERGPGREERARDGPAPLPQPLTPATPARHNPGGPMKVRNSIRSVKNQPGSQVVRRRGRTYVINKRNPRLKTRQG